MASNQIPNGYEDLFILGEDIAVGCHNHEATIGLKQNTEADVRLDLTSAVTAQNNYKIAQTTRATLGEAMAAADDNIGNFLGSARAVLANFLGNRWSAAWDATGFPNQSTAVPRSLAERMTLLRALQNYFTAKPEQENIPLNVTAAQAGKLFTAYSDARNAAAESDSDLRRKRDARDAAIQALRRRLSGLVSELGQLLGANDPQWLSFGLNLPGASDLPDPADKVTLTGGTAGTVLANWVTGMRGSRSRVFKQVVGVDNTFVSATTVNDDDCTLNGLPSGKTLRVYVVCANDAGQSSPSDTAEIVVP